MFAACKWQNLPADKTSRRGAGRNGMSEPRTSVRADPRRLKPAARSVSTSLCVWASGALALTLSSGCPQVSFPGGSGSQLVDGNRDAVTSPLGKTSGEPNGSFQQAIIAVFDSSGVAGLQGTISTLGDLDVFRLGAVSAGDRLIVDAMTPGSSLDVALAVFDDEERLVFYNDDRTPTNFDAYIDWVVRHGGESYYLVVAASAFAGTNQTTGTYLVDVTLEPDGDVPPPVGQVLLLNFDGGTVELPGLGTKTILPFEAGAIGSAYAGQTETMKQAIREVCVQNFQRFDVGVVTSDDPPPAQSIEFSTIFFGGFSAGAFGIADSVDAYNQDFCDDAIIYTESFGPRVFSFTPTASELALAIANVASHEAGHLLGLNHVDDDRDLMDDRSPADAFIFDQEFMQAPLSTDLMSLGTQDGVLLLTEIVGLSAAPAARLVDRGTAAARQWLEEASRPVPQVRKVSRAAATKGLRSR